mmetsp:Transcript_45416/g.145724  ORF Transcript_45416/g.145724 Transcript_45416/m.145724 type:complete len:412 (-) Transcript_45416:270-1505(-)
MSGCVAESSQPWSVGPWTLEPRGLALCGNAAAAPGEEARRVAAKVRADTASAGGGGEASTYSQRLSSLQGADCVVTQQEVSEFLELAGQGEALWEGVSSDARTNVQRHRDRSLCGGVFVKMSAHIPTATDLSHVAACYLDFADRATWDKQVDGFRTLHSKEGSDALYYTMHVPPLSDRDFVIFHAILRHESGKGVLLYMRHADPSFVPHTRAVRACCYVTVVEITEHPEGGASVVVIAAVDPKIPFLPKWIVNALVPSEWRKNVAEVERHCSKLAAAGTRPACAALFGPRPQPGEAPGAAPAAEAAAKAAAGDDDNNLSPDDTTCKDSGFFISGTTRSPSSESGASTPPAAAHSAAPAPPSAPAQPSAPALLERGASAAKQGALKAEPKLPALEDDAVRPASMWCGECVCR